MLGVKRTRKTMLALLFMFLCIGGVGAVVYSATLHQTVNLNAIYPVALTWASGTGPTGNQFAVIPMTDTLNVQNLDDVNWKLKLRFSMTVPEFADATDFQVKIEGGALVFTLSAGKYVAEYDCGGITQLQTKPYAFEWKFFVDSILGGYVLDIYADQYT